MQQIILKLNLKYILEALSLQQKGLLLDALLNTDEDDEPTPDVIAQRVHNDAIVANLYKYIFLLQKDINAKQQRMRELGAKGGMAKKRNKNSSADTPLLDLFQTQAPIDDDNETSLEAPQQTTSEFALRDKLDADVAIVDAEASLVDTEALTVRKAPLKPKRKVTKEKFLNIKNNFISRANKQISLSAHQKQVPKDTHSPLFVPPSVDEVKDYTEKNGLLVDPEVFVNFYEARDWFVGKTAIKKWKPVVKLWHNRALENKSANASAEERRSFYTHSAELDDETYWSALEEKVKAQNGANADFDKKTIQNVVNSSCAENEIHGDVALSSAKKETALALDCGRSNRRDSDNSVQTLALVPKNAVEPDLSKVGKFDSDILSAPQNSAQSLGGDYAGLSPFTRFMRRIEDFDLAPEEKL